MYGSIGTKTLELVQIAHHFMNGTYLVYQKSNKLSKLSFIASLFDKHVRTAHGQYWRHILRNPIRALRPIYYQEYRHCARPGYAGGW